MTMAPVEDPSANNRRPSELNAATDLVGLCSPSASGTAGAGQPESKEGPKPIKVEPKEEGTSAPLQGHGQGPSQVSSGAPGGSYKPQDKDGGDGDGDGDDPEKTAFPLLLHEVVSDPATDSCIHWLACGTRFMISDKKKFARDVLPRFYGNAKFTSFTRRLKRWSFTRVPSGPFMGAYFNPHFQRGAPELAARVRYDHPTQLSNAVMQMNKAKLQAVGSLGGMMGGMVGFVNPFMVGVPVAQGQEALLLQMNANGMANGMVNGMVNGMASMGMMGAMPGTVMGQNANLESLYLAMQQNAAAAGGQGQAIGAQGNIAAANNNIALQMAMAQEMMQQQQRQAQMGVMMGQGAAAGGFGPMDQARLLAQQQQQQVQQQLTAAGFGAPGPAPTPAAGEQGQPGQQQAGKGPEDQRLLAAMFLERLTKQNQPPGAYGQPQQNQPQQNQPQQNQPQLQSQQNQAQVLGGNNFQGGSSAPALVSVTPNSSVGGGVNAGFPGPQAQNGSGGTLSDGIKQASAASLTTLPGGQASAPANPGGTLFQLSYPGTVNAAGGGAGAAAPVPQGDPGAMNALLADYLRRTGGAAGEPAPVGAATAPGQEGKGDVKPEAAC